MPEDVHKQIELAFSNTKKTLHAAGVVQGWTNVYHMTMYYTGLDEKFAAALKKMKTRYLGSNRPALTGLMVKEIYKAVLFEVTSAGSSRVSLQLCDDKKLVAAIKHRLGFDLHCPIFSRLTMLLVRRGCQFLKAYGVFLGFLLVLIICGESTGSSSPGEATISSTNCLRSNIPRLGLRSMITSFSIS